MVTVIDNIVHNTDEHTEFMDYPTTWWKSAPLELNATDINVWLNNYKCDRKALSFSSMKPKFRKELDKIDKEKHPLA
jgi:hypothetical protein